MELPISRHLAVSLRENIEEANRLYEPARRLAEANRKILFALASDAGQNPEDCSNIQLKEEGGAFFLVLTPKPSLAPKLVKSKGGES